jgi:polyhydroxyalkanoate synthesis regulator phasin
MSAEQEKEMLKREAQNLKETMNRLEQRIQELEDQSS